MPIQRSHLESTQDLASLLGPRQADVMRLLWTRGPATVRQLLTWLTADPPISYQNIMTICERLTEKGLLERRLATSADESARYGQAYVYTPRVSEDEFMRMAVGQQSAVSTTRPLDTGSDRARVEQALAYLGTMHGENDQRSDDILVHTIAALLERAETAERAAATWEAKAHHAELQMQAAERRALAAGRRAEKAERRVETLLQQMNRPPKPERKQRAPLGVIIEHRDPAGICRVCGQPAPPASAARRDDLRVCVAEVCRKEGQRRDNLAKQRRYNERRSAGQAQVVSAMGTAGSNNL